MYTCFLLVSMMLAFAQSHMPTKGPYKSKVSFFTFPRGEGSDAPAKMHVYYPADAQAHETFPLVSYAHGLLGGSIDLLGYYELFKDIASFGFILVAPDTCNLGCSDATDHPYTDCNPVVEGSSDPLPYRSFFGEQLKAIEWTRNMSKNGTEVPFSKVDWDAGVGIAGHSMGGQATTWAAHDDCAARWNIKAAVLHHAFEANVNGGNGSQNAGLNITKTPLAAFTSRPEPCCEGSTKAVFEASSSKQKLYRDIWWLANHPRATLGAALVQPPPRSLHRSFPQDLFEPRW
jgi:hypothetical protein